MEGNLEVSFISFICLGLGLELNRVPRADDCFGHNGYEYDPELRAEERLPAADNQPKGFFGRTKKPTSSATSSPVTLERRNSNTPESSDDTGVKNRRQMFQRLQVEQSDISK